MARGVTKTLYVKSNNLKFCDELSKIAEENGSSFSDYMNEAIQQEYFQRRTGVWISPGAYLAIANGELNTLECVQSRDGGVDLILKKDAPSLAGEGMDSTYPALWKETVYSIGTGMLQHAKEPNQ